VDTCTIMETSCIVIKFKHFLNTKCMLNICCIAEHARGLEENFLKYVIKIGMHFLQNYKSQITWMDDH
jgi:hypothetical protein